VTADTVPAPPSAVVQDHYKLALGQVNMARNLIDKIARGASCFRLGRLGTVGVSPRGFASQTT